MAQLQAGGHVGLDAAEMPGDPCRIGSSASQRLALEEAWMPANSPEQ